MQWGTNSKTIKRKVVRGWNWTIFFSKQDQSSLTEKRYKRSKKRKKTQNLRVGIPTKNTSSADTAPIDDRVQIN